jgi:hypothetical protein
MIAVESQINTMCLDIQEELTPFLSFKSFAFYFGLWQASTIFARSGPT